MPNSLHPPPSVIASWPAPNYINPATRGNALVVIVIFLTILTTLIVIARIWARFALVRQPGLDDGLTVLSFCFGVAFSVTIIVVSTKYGDGHHAWDVPPSKRETSRYYTWLAEWFFILSTTITKVSILLFYKRLVAGTYSRRFIWATQIGIYFNIASSLAFLLMLLLECRPMNAYWKSYGPDYKESYTCSHEEISLPISGLFSVAGDFYATLLPFLLLRKLQLPKSQKLALYGIFSLGGLVIISGIMRTVFLYTALNKTWDLTWNICVTWIWSAVEVHVSIICASAPALKPFFVRIFRNPSSFHSTHGYALSSNPRSPSVQPYSNLSSTSRHSRQNRASSLFVKGAEFHMARVIAHAEYAPRSLGTTIDLDKLEDDDQSSSEIRVHTKHSVDYEQAV